MSVEQLLRLMEAAGRARTLPGLEHALEEHLAARVRLTRDRDGAWRCRTKSRAYPSDTLDRVVAIVVEHIAVLGRVADLNRRTTQDAETLRDEVRRIVLPGAIVASSPQLRRIFHELVPLVARTETTVLIRGETGTGKEVIARQVHVLSTRSHRPFLAINCGALPEQLVESTLFGHERGAFTGAERSQPGVFERADGGTLFLDEIGDLALAAQVKLLRVATQFRLRSQRARGASTARTVPPRHLGCGPPRCRAR